VGPALQGRKVVVSLSPCWFFTRLTVRPDAYAGNFSDLHAGELAFNTGLSLQLRQDAARRMLQFPATVANRPLLRFALENLASLFTERWSMVLGGTFILVMILAPEGVLGAAGRLAAARRRPSPP